MKNLIIFIVIFISSCGYDDLDSVPNFENLNITKSEELDLCKLKNIVKKDFLKCVKEVNNTD